MTDNEKGILLRSGRVILPIKSYKDFLRELGGDIEETEKKLGFTSVKEIPLPKGLEEKSAIYFEKFNEYCRDCFISVGQRYDLASLFCDYLRDPHLIYVPSYIHRGRKIGGLCAWAYLATIWECYLRKNITSKQFTKLEKDMTKNVLPRKSFVDQSDSDSDDDSSSYSYTTSDEEEEYEPSRTIIIPAHDHSECEYLKTYYNATNNLPNETVTESIEKKVSSEMEVPNGFGEVAGDYLEELNSFFQDCRIDHNQLNELVKEFGKQLSWFPDDVPQNKIEKFCREAYDHVLWKTFIDEKISRRQFMSLMERRPKFLQKK